MRFERLDSGAFVKGADGSLYPILAQFRTDDPALDYTITVELGFASGKPICKAVTAQQRSGGIPVTRRGLNAIPLTRIVEEISRQFALQLEKTDDGTAVRDSTSAEQDRISRALQPERGRKRDPLARRALLEQVAAMYQELIDNKIMHPKPVIAKRLGYSQSYVGTLIAEARSAKPPLLGRPDGPGRAGSTKKGRGAHDHQAG